MMNTVLLTRLGANGSSFSPGAKSTFNFTFPSLQENEQQTRLEYILIMIPERSRLPRWASGRRLICEIDECREMNGELQ